ncbi:thioredoxin-like protein [Coniosporium apollinis CBS 100218]|uniref:Thioredoxin-like protein n=1 Tax=Coniosporium apollinis (strain CBS 100218) TaxID=1168221 RepID=R7YSD6_CONA1|nr:thioredoxin-like protein [Coniosporium apollinis CBS 100218]EON64753.1 thioredoxin-like protein [Coniosporium apollinis CBS 100218]
MASATLPRSALRVLSRTRPSLSAVATISKSPAASKPLARCLHQSATKTWWTASQRPSMSALRQTSTPATPNSRRTIFIQTEPTPNADALKFNPHHRVLPENIPTPYLEYLSPRSTLAPPYPSPLAAQLLAVDGVTAVFFGADYITVTKDPGTPWAHVKPEVFSLITEFVTSGREIVTASAAGSSEGQGEEAGQGGGQRDSLEYDENDSEVVSMIKELLETRIRPAIQEDGGDIEFRGFHDGQVLLKLRGACRTCDSSTVTLKNGIESMLMHYIDEVRGVQQVLDQEEEVALREFAAFEEKLRKQGKEVPATTVGKGSLDFVE